MARFAQHFDVRKFRRKLILGYIYTGAATSLLFLLIFYPYDNGLRQVLSMVCIVNIGWYGIDYLRKSKIKELFIDIDEHKITWQYNDGLKTMSVEWNDIRWIKNDRNETILLFRASSFTDSFSIKGYPEETKAEIFSLLEQYASQRNIRLISFSEPVLAMT